MPSSPQAATSTTSAAASGRRRLLGIGCDSIGNDAPATARSRVTGLHTALGYILIAVNGLAGLAGGWAWWRGTQVRVFWPLLRAGQLLVLLQAAGGVALLVQGRSLPRL